VALMRTVFLPLASEPDILFGLHVEDLLWLALAGAGDLAVWHRTTRIAIRVLLDGVISGGGLAGGFLRIDGVSAVRFLFRVGRYWAGPRIFIP
jgi:hypothetical protein